MAVLIASEARGSMQGEVYDLGILYRELNYLYFASALQLQVTWFGVASRRHRSRIILGQYHYDQALIKIHRRLDDRFFPDYFVSFVLYHEMLHAVIPGYRDIRGRWRQHTAAFKARERLFLYYEEAVAWERHHKQALFT